MYILLSIKCSFERCLFSVHVMMIAIFGSRCNKVIHIFVIINTMLFVKINIGSYALDTERAWKCSCQKHVLMVFVNVEVHLCIKIMISY